MLITLILFLERALFVIAITIPFDIRDIEIDNSNAVSTIPSILGIYQSIVLSIGLLTICVLIEIYMYDGNGSIAAILTYCISGCMIYTFQHIKEDYYFAGFIDGTFMFPYMILMLIR